MPDTTLPCIGVRPNVYAPEPVSESQHLMNEEVAEEDLSDQQAEAARTAKRGDVALVLILDALRHEMRASRIAQCRMVEDLTASVVERIDS